MEAASGAVPPGPPRYTGFAAEELSRLFHRRVIEQHVSEAGFLWMRREEAARAPHYKLAHLAMLDARVHAHLLGVRVAGEIGWRACAASLEQPDAGVIFTAAYSAFASGERQKMLHVLQLGAATKHSEAALRAGLSWLEAHEARVIVDSLLRSSLPRYQQLALATLGHQGVDPGEYLTPAMANQDSALRACALRLAGQFRRRDLTAAAKASLQDDSPACRFWGAWSLSLLGEPQGAEWLISQTLTAPEHTTCAVRAAVRFSDFDAARNIVRTFAAHPNTLRHGISAAEALGDPAAIPWLLGHLADVNVARRAAEAFCTITGADLHSLGLKEDRPRDVEEGAAPEDKDLPWPHAERVVSWWNHHRGQFTRGQRYLAGQVLSESACADVLAQGYQRQRRAAALEMCRLVPERPLFNIEDRADRQRRSLP